MADWAGSHELGRAHLASLVEDFRQHSAEIAVVAHRGNRRFATTYGELARLAGRFAAELDRQGIGPGERVVLWGENSADWIATFFGCLLRGVIAVPLDAAGSTEFVGRVVQDVAPRLIVSDRRLLGLLPPSQVPHLLFSDLTGALPPNSLLTVSDAVQETTPFQIVFTSGTTSEPKGIVHSHRNVLASLRPIEAEMAKYLRYERLVHPLRFLHSLPLSHVFGQFLGLWIPALLAAEVHFFDQLEPARMTELIRRERISVLIAVPRVLELLRGHLLRQFAELEEELTKAKGLPIWKRLWRFRRVHRALGWKFWAVISGGATLPAELEGFWNQLGFALIQGYGMTETAALVTLNHPFRIGQGTLGKALPGREVRLSDEGEILVRGDMLAQSTWQAGAIRPRQGEWLATGDLATQGDMGELRFVGRKGDIIVTAAGMNVYPADLEGAMTQQPHVRGCVVVPCETMTGPEPLAVLLFSGSEAALQEAVARANDGLAEYQRIRRVLRWPEMQFPYTSTGKLLRRSIRDWACAKLAEHNGQPAEAGRDLLLDTIAGLTGEQPPSSGGDNLRLTEDLHLDSLGRVQLQSALEHRLGVELEDAAMAQVETLGHLRALVDAQVTSPPGPPTNPVPTIATSHLDKPTEKGGVSEIADVYPHWPWTWPFRLVRTIFIETMLRPLVWMLAAPKVSRARRPLLNGPLIVVANHVTAYDGALILYALPPRLRRRIAAAMSGEMLRDFRQGQGQDTPLLNLLAPAAYWLLIALFNVFPLPRQRGFRRSFAHVGDALDHGFSVLIFPEGTRSRTANLQPFRQGIGLLVEESRVPVLPVALVGLGEMRAKKHRWFRSGRLEVRVGEAIPFDEAMDPAERTAQLHKGIRELLEERKL